MSNTWVRSNFPDIFTSYTIESYLLNGKVHYTSGDGTKAISYLIGDGAWGIQDAWKRYIFTIISSFVIQLSTIITEEENLMAMLTPRATHFVQMQQAKPGSPSISSPGSGLLPKMGLMFNARIAGKVGPQNKIGYKDRKDNRFFRTLTVFGYSY